jgi:hypothetical protein
MPCRPTTPGKKKGCLGWIVVALVLIAALAIWTLRGHGPISKGIADVHEVDGVAQVHSIVKAMTAYAADHGGAYPEGASSTEVFQKLLDDHYVSDTKTFFVLTGGKYPADSSQLQSQNVCFDVTAGASAKSPDDLPLVFATGFKVTYAAGAHATHATDIAGILPGIAVGYKNGSAHFRRSAPDGSVPDVVPAGFDARGETYRQLTP